MIQFDSRICDTPWNIVQTLTVKKKKEVSLMKKTARREGWKKKELENLHFNIITLTTSTIISLEQWWNSETKNLSPFNKGVNEMLQNIFTKQISFYTSSEMVLNNLLSFMFFSFSTYSNNFLLRLSNTFFSS